MQQITVRKNELALQSWEDVDWALGEMAKLENEKNTKLSKIKAEIAKLKADMESVEAEYSFRLRTLELQIKAFAKLHLDEIRSQKKKSMALTNGTITTKEKKNYIYPPDEELILAIKQAKLQDKLLVVKEIPQKAVIRSLAKHNPEILQKLGIEVEEDIDIKIKLL